MDFGGPTAQPGMSLSVSHRPVPARLVSQIQSAHYVEMRDLLGDNTAIGRQLEDIRTTMGANVLQVSSGQGCHIPRIMVVLLPVLPSGWYSKFSHEGETGICHSDN